MQFHGLPLFLACWRAAKGQDSETWGWNGKLDTSILWCCQDPKFQVESLKQLATGAIYWLVVASFTFEGTKRWCTVRFQVIAPQVLISLIVTHIFTSTSLRASYFVRWRLSCIFCKSIARMIHSCGQAIFVTNFLLFICLCRFHFVIKLLGHSSATFKCSFFYFYFFFSFLCFSLIAN